MLDCDVGAADIIRKDADDICEREQRLLAEPIADGSCQLRGLCILHRSDLVAGADSLCSWKLAMCGEIAVRDEHLLVVSQVRYVQVNLAVRLSRPCRSAEQIQGAESTIFSLMTNEYSDHQ